jgi:hypothetical protein
VPALLANDVPVFALEDGRRLRQLQADGALERVQDVLQQNVAGHAGNGVEARGSLLTSPLGANFDPTGEVVHQG